MTSQVLNSKGEPVLLNATEQEMANMFQAQFDALPKTFKNALGSDISFTTLSQIQSRIIQQKFYEIAPAEYVPIRVGTGAWAQQLVTLREYAMAGDFEHGIINLGSNMSRLAEDGVGMDSITVPTVAWAKQITWSLPELATAQRTGNWDIVSAKERVRKRDWDLGIQKIAFWGLSSTPGVYGLLTLPNVTANTTLITESISGMDATEFNAFLQGMLTAYQAQVAYTVMPNRLIMPQADYLGLVAPSNPAMPIISRLEMLENAFKKATGRQDFRILPSPYADKTMNASVSGLNKNRYVLYRYDDESVRMEIPVDYTGTLAGTINNFQFENVAYGQFTGVNTYRPLEMLYFDY